MVTPPVIQWDGAEQQRNISGERRPKKLKQQIHKEEIVIEF